MEDGRLCIVMEFANLGTLEDDKRLIKEEWCVWRFLFQIAAALNYLHTLTPAPVLHRDLKPANVLCMEVWNEAKGCNEVALKIADFGVAKLLNMSAQGNFYSGTRAGSPTYMAPEVSSLPVNPTELIGRNYSSLYNQ